ncbi:unnamed protein product, partial [Brassica rapa]
MGEASEQATMMQVLNALREEMRVMRQDLGERMTRVEQRPPPLQPVRNVDRFLNPNNRRYGVPVHDNPETSTRTSRLMKTRDSSTVQYQTREQGCHQMTMVKKKRRKGLHLNPELHAGKTGTKGL